MNTEPLNRRTNPKATQAEGTAIRAALVNAQKALSGIAKTSENKFGEYKYASAEDVMHACRTALHASGLAARRTRWCVEGEGPIYWVVCSFELVHESGEVEAYPMATRWPFMEAKGHPLDKRLAGALTLTLAYWLRDLLNVPRELQEEDMDKRDDRAYEPAPEVLGIARAGRLRIAANKAGTTIEEIRDRLRGQGLTIPDEPSQWPAAIAPTIAEAFKMNA